MLSKEERQQINQLLKTHNIKRKNDVFTMINQGSTLEEVHHFIQSLIEENERDKKPSITLRSTHTPYSIFGQSLISRNALDDMEAIMKLPYVMGGALMPDGHRVKENHVPVGGVVISEMIVPGIVGSDIACSVLLTITSQEVDSQWFEEACPSLKYVLRHHTYFGQEMNPEGVVNHQPFFNETLEMETALGEEIYALVRKIARNHFGTSGDGNHFVEIGAANIQHKGSEFHGTGKKRYLAILSHFGSRAVGSTIAEAFKTAALELVDMPKGMSDAPLAPDTPLGRDYWKLMTWAGEFAEAGHRWLHQHVLAQIDNRVPLDYSDSHTIYTKHNFAWLSDWGYVHRKGATPAEFGQYGVIPATMGDETQIVLGLGCEDSFYSTSHGAGRRYSRGNALQQFGSNNTAAFLLKEYGVHLIGGGADEDPRAYKTIKEVMQAQTSCASTVGVFMPVVVRMADPRFTWR